MTADTCPCEAYIRLRYAARHVLASREGGDLAGAVRELADLLDSQGDDSDDETSCEYRVNSKTRALARAIGALGT